MNRFSKDIDTIDNMLGGQSKSLSNDYNSERLLADSLRMLVATSSNILGAIILVSIILPWFLIAVVVILSVYLYAAHFYRASARELKRLGVSCVIFFIYMLITSQRRYIEVFFIFTLLRIAVWSDYYPRLR